MSAFTKGKWRVCSPKLNHLITDENGNTIATIKGSRIESMDERPKANAVLMASAPALLEALQDLKISANTVAACYSRNPGNFAAALQNLRDSADRARAVYDAATGETK